MDQTLKETIENFQNKIYKILLVSTSKTICNIYGSMSLETTQVIWDMVVCVGLYLCQSLG